MLFQAAEIGQLSFNGEFDNFLVLFLLFAFRCSLCNLLLMLSET